jgi:hypothetical protein
MSVTRRAARLSCSLRADPAAGAVEAIAVEIFRQAESSHQLVTMSMISRVLEQLRAHCASCRCGLCGETVVKARADRVFRTAQIWQRSVAVTRARAVR